MAEKMDMSTLEGLKKMIEIIKNAIGFLNDDTVTVCPPPKYSGSDDGPDGTYIIGNAIMKIYDENDELVGKEWLIFKNVFDKDPNKLVIYIGRMRRNKDDIKISKAWTGAKYVSRHDCYILYDPNSESMTLHNDESRHKIWDAEKKHRLPRPVEIKNGTVVSLAGIMKVEFMIGTNKEMIEEMEKPIRTKNKVACNRNSPVEDSAIWEYDDITNSNPIPYDKHMNVLRKYHKVTRQYKDLPIARVL